MILLAQFVNIVISTGVITFFPQISISLLTHVIHTHEKGDKYGNFIKTLTGELLFFTGKTTVRVGLYISQMQLTDDAVRIYF